MTMPLFSFGQFSFGLSVGASNYQGDIAKDLTNLNETHAAFAASVGYRLNRYFDVKGQILLTKLTGDDANYEERRHRGFRFRTNILELAGILEYYTLGSAVRSRTGVFVPHVTPVFFMGLGIAKLDNLAECYSEDCKNGVVLNPFPEPDYKSVLFNVPFGIGLKYDVSPLLAVGLRGGYRYTFSDYLDGISAAANRDKNDWYFFLGANVTFYLGEKKKEVL